MAAVGAVGGGSGFGVATGAAGFLAAIGGFAFAGSFLAAGLPSVGFSAGASAGFSAPGGVSEIWATALAVSISTLARIDIEWRNFIPGAIPVRPYLVLCFVLMPRRSLAGSPVRHLPVLALPRADRPRRNLRPARNPRLRR